MTTTGFLPAAPLSAETKEPYTWRILLRTTKHPFLDNAVRERLGRELKAALQPSLGPLGSVEVIDLATATNLDAISKEFQAKGFAALEPAANRPLNGIKYHGLNIDYKEGAYQLNARQYDGFTGLASPLLRTKIVRTPDQIARMAGILLEPDLGAVGTVEVIPTDATHVMLVMRGNALGPVETLVKKGDIFAVSVIKENKPTGLVGAPVQFTLLKVVEPVANGSCKCVILTRWASPFGREARKAAGIRAMKLPTIQSPVRVQLVDRNGKPHTRGSTLAITASDIDLTAKPTDTDRFEWRDGLYRSLRPFTGVACISLGLNGQAPQFFPVPVLSEDVLTLSFNIDPVAEKRAEFVRDCNDLRFRVADLFIAQHANAAALSKLLDATQNRDALARAETGRDTIAAAEKLLSEELKQLLLQPGATSDPTAKEILDACDRQLLAVRDGVSQLVTTIASLKDAIGKAGSAGNLEKDFRGQELATRIKDLLARGEVPEAIDAYDQLVKLFPSEDSYRDSREKLKAEWAPKDDVHRQARDVIRTLAAAKTVDEFKAVNDLLRKAIPLLKAKKDRLGLRKLLNTYEPALSTFNELVLTQDRQPASAEKQQALAALDEVLEGLKQMMILTRIDLKELSPDPKK